LPALGRRIEGAMINDFEQGQIGSDLFRYACLMGLEGISRSARGRPIPGGAVVARLDQSQNLMSRRWTPARGLHCYAAA
jgi:hypothetical protein